jgi:hypothetical protein
MLRFFKTFVQCRELEQSLREASDARFELQGEVRALRGEVERMKEDLSASQKHERDAYQMLVNVDYQLKYGFAPFPDAPKLPEKLETHDTGGPVDSGYVPGRMLVEQGLAASREDFNKWLDGSWKQE